MASGRPAQRNGGVAMAEANHGAQESALPWWRFSLKQLLLAMAYVALGCVALRSANTTWVGAMVGLTWIALAASLLLAMYRDGQDRAFWVGFAVAGWLYLLLPVFGWSFMSNLQGNTVITTRISHWAYDWLYAQPLPAPASGFGPPMSGYGGSMGSADGSMMGGPGGGMPGMGGMSGMGMGGMPGGPGGPPFPTFSGPSREDFTNVSHALWTLLLAFCGGWFAQWLYATRGRSTDVRTR
jgi:hypothetical protein